ncbi:uncharacterized protein [Argopecten irradians]|uniref:uncharacterized protein n=1 Tax=Argopecten irradians TaxID=31199 RepID=UPI0037118E66
MSADSFTTFLCKEICQKLSEEDVKKMAFCIHDKVTRQELDNANTGTDLLRIAMEANVFSETDTAGLENILDATGRKDLLQTVREYKKSRKDLSLERAPCNVEESMIRGAYMETKASQKLTEELEKEDGIILSGTSGSGKTQMALHYGNKVYKAHSTSTVWMMRSKDQASLQMSMTKLANKLGILKGKSKDTENPINELADMTANVLLKKTADVPQIIIFDEVNQFCREIVVDIVKKLLPSPRGNVKIIITTVDTLLEVGNAKRIIVNGFTEEEAILFLSDGKRCEISERDALTELAKRMSYLPLGLNCAKAYMRNCSKSGMKFLELLNAKTLKRLDGKLKQLGDNNRGLFSNLNAFITIMETDLDEDAIEMFKMTQFLECENIPTVMFELLSPSSECDVMDSENKMQNDAVCCSFSTDSLVQAVQRFSFGTVQGIDDRRTLNMHSAVSLTLAAFTEEETKKRLLKRLLWTFALILDKENRDTNDYNLMVSILPQAKSVLLHAMDSKIKDIETLVLIAMVNDLVAYTSDFEGLSVQEKYHSHKSLEYWYKVIGMDEEICSHLGTSYAEHRKFAKVKAAEIDAQMATLQELQSTEIESFIRHFVLQKIRPERDVLLFSKLLENYKGKTLTMHQYDILCKKETAVPLKYLTESFIQEMITYSFYTYGRRIFYTGKYADINEKRKCCHYLFLADELGVILQSKCPKFTPLVSMLAKVSGTLALVTESIPEMGIPTAEDLHETAKRYEKLLQDESFYFKFGISNKQACEDNIHRLRCQKQLLCVYIELLRMTGNGEIDKPAIIEKGNVVIKELESGEAVSNDQKIRGIWSRIGQFWFVAGENKEAEKAFRRASPPCILSGEVSSRFLPKHELTAVYGLVDCYRKEERHEEAIRILQNLLHMLPETQKREIDNAQKRMDSIRKEL